VLSKYNSLVRTVGCYRFSLGQTSRVVLVQIEDVEALLEFSSDPFADMRTAVNADVSAMGQSITLESVKGALGPALSTLDSFPQLCNRARSVRLPYALACWVHKAEIVHIYCCWYIDGDGST
jgi:hypothetical protein